MSSAPREEFNVRGIANVMFWMAWICVIPAIAAAVLTALLDIQSFIVAILGFLIGCWLLNGYRIERSRSYETVRMQRWFWAVSVAYNGLPPLIVAALYVVNEPNPLVSVEADLRSVVGGLNSDNLFAIILSCVVMYTAFWLPVATIFSSIALQKTLVRKPVEKTEEVAT